jgi:hypothetical protein
MAEAPDRGEDRVASLVGRREHAAEARSKASLNSQTRSERTAALHRCNGRCTGEDIAPAQSSLARIS